MSSWRGKKKSESAAPVSKPLARSPQPSAPESNAGQSWRKRREASTSTGSYWTTGGRKKSLIPNNLKKLFVALLVVFTSTALFSWYLMRTDQVVPYLYIANTDFKKPFAANGWAAEEQKLFSDETVGFKKTLVRVTMAEPGRDAKSLALLLDSVLAPQLAKLADNRLHLTPGGPGGRLVFRKYGAVVIHLNTHGVVNQNGDPCLILSDAEPLDDTTWVPLRTVLMQISELCSQYPDPVKALVLLDCARQLPDARIGLFTMGFAEEAKREINALKRDNLAVLLSAGENQISWAAPELGASVFGVNLLRGLQGEADVSGNKRITVKELAQYVTQQTQAYVARSRTWVQTPVLCWSGNAEQDFEVAYTGQQRFTAKQKPTFGSVTWEKTSSKQDPWRVAELVADEQHAQDSAWAGPGYQEKTQVESHVHGVLAPAYGTVGVSLHQLIRLGEFDPNLKVQADYKPADGAPPAAGDAGAASGAPGNTATAPTTSGAPTQNTAATAAPSTATLKVAADALTPDKSGKFELAQAVPHWLNHDRAAVKEKPIEPPVPLSDKARFHAVYQSLQWLAKDPQRFNARQLGYIVDGLLARYTDPMELTREEALLRNIYSYLDTTSGWELGPSDNIKPETWKALFDVHQQYELAISVQDARASLALEPASQRLSNEYRLMLDAFFDADSPAAVTNANRRLDQVSRLAQETTQQRNNLENAWKASDEAARALPLLWEWQNSILKRHEIDNSLESIKELTQLRTTWQSLQRTLSGGDVPTLEQIAVTNDALSSLVNRFRSERPVAANVQTDTVKTLAQYQLLASVRPIDDEQSYLISETQKKFEDLFREVSRSPSAIAELIATAKPQSEIVYKEISREALAEHAEMMNAVIAANGDNIALPDAGTSARETSVKYGGFVRSKAANLVGKIGKLDSLNEAFQSEEDPQIASANRGYLEKDSQARLAANLLPARVLEAEAPSMFVQAMAKQNDVLWHARRLIDDFWATPIIAPNTPYFERAAQAWLKEASNIEAQSLLHMRSGTQKLAERQLADATKQAVAWRNLLKDAPQAPVASDSFKIQFDWNTPRFPSGEARLNLFIGSDMKKAAKLRGNGTVATANIPLAVGNQRQNVEREPVSVPTGNFDFHQIAITYRGHVADYSFSPPQAEAPRVLGWNVDKLQPSSIQVRALSKPRKIIFILDCSNSMKIIAKAGEPPVPDPLKYFNQAKEELVKAISTLNDPQIQIAVIVFGHSKDWKNKDEDNTSSWFTKTGRPVVNRRAYNDVETIFNFGERAVDADGVVNGKLRSYIESLEPFGRTPLYLSLIEAANLLRDEPNYAGNQRIVVITDGANEVAPTQGTRVRDDWVPREFQISVERVKSLLPRDKFRLDIIPFKAEVSFPEFVSKDTPDPRFEVHKYAPDGSALSDALRQSLENETYNVFAIDNKTGAQKPNRLNDYVIDLGKSFENIAKNQPGIIPGDFVVRVGATGSEGRLPLALFGGELLEIEYDVEAVQGKRFMYESFRENRRVDVINSDANYLAKSTPREIVAPPQNPITAIATVFNMPQRDRLRVALENNNRYFQSRRPDQVLVELARSAQDPPLAWTADTQWDPRFLVPVFGMPLDRKKLFPTARPQDRVLKARVWLRKLPENLRAYTFSELSNEVELDNGARVTATFETQFDKGTLTVTERFDAPVLVAWTISPAADVSLEHRFYKNRVEHKYIYSSPDVRDRLRFTASIVDATNKSWESTDWFDATE